MQLALQPKARNTDPVTSHLAADSIFNQGNVKSAIYALLRSRGSLTDQEIESYLGHMASPSGLRTRRKELMRVGMVEDSGETVQLPTGRRAILWRAIA